MSIETRILWWMMAVAALSLMFVGTIGGFWVAISYAAGLVLVARGYWIWFACRPRMISISVHTLTGIYVYREVARG